MTVEECREGSELKRLMDAAITEQMMAGEANIDPKRSAAEHEERFNRAKDDAFKAEKEFIQHKHRCPVCRRSDD